LIIVTPNSYLKVDIEGAKVQIEKMINGDITIESIEDKEHHETHTHNKNYGYRSN